MFRFSHHQLEYLQKTIILFSDLKIYIQEFEVMKDQSSHDISLHKVHLNSMF